MAADTVAPSPGFFTDESGAVFQVAPENIDAVAKAGLYQPATPDQIAQHQRTETYGTTGQQIKTGLEGALRGATLGLSTPVERALGVDPEAIAARQEVNPGISTASEIGGTALPLFLAPEVAGPKAVVEGVATAAEHAAPTVIGKIASLTPPSAVSRLGRAAAGMVGEAPEAAGIVRRVLQKAAAEGAGSAVEGAAYGAGHVIHEAALGDPDLTAQNAISEIGLSALLGGGLGAALGLGIGATKEAVNAGRDAIGKLRDLVVEHYPTLGHALSGAAREDIENLGENRAMYREGKTTRDIVDSQSPEVAEPIPSEPGTPPTPTATDPDVITRDFKSGLGDVLRANKEGLSESWMKFRPAERALAADANQKEVLQSGLRAYKSMNSALRELESKPYVSSMYASKLEGARDAMVDAMEGGDPVDYFTAMDEAKQAIGSWAKYGHELTPEAREGVSVARDVYGTLQKELERGDIWGEAGIRQGEFNRPFARLSNAKQNIRFLMDRTAASGGPVWKPSSKKIASFLKNIGEETNVDNEAKFAEFMAASEAMHDQIEKSSHAVAATDYNREAAQSLIDRTRAATGDARANVAASEADDAAQSAFKGTEKDRKAEWQRLQKEFRANVKDRDAANTNAAVALKGPQQYSAVDLLGAGAVFHNPLTAPLYLGYRALKALESPERVYSTLAALEEMNQSVQRRLADNASTLARGGAKAAAIGRAESLAGIAKSVGLPPDAAKRLYDKRTAQVQSFHADPDVTASALAGTVSDINSHAPDTSQALQTSLVQSMAYLAKQIPDTTPTGPLAQPRVPSREEVAKFHRIYDVVNDPLSIVKHASAGTVRPDEVAALEATAPALLNNIRLAITEQIAKNGPPAFKYRRGISILMGEDMDGTTSPASVMANQTVYRTQTQEMGKMHPSARSASGKSPTAQATMLPSQKIEEGLT